MRVPLQLLSLALSSSLVCWTQTRADWHQMYLFAYPLVLMDVTREAAGAENTLAHTRAFPTDQFRAVVRPNADTLYSTAWLDLSKEPLLLRVPDTGGRYYMMQLLDAWTETIAVPGKRTTGTGEGWFAIVGPGWNGKLPDQVKQRIESPTNMVWLLGRTQTNGAADYAKVHAIQNGFRLMPLSRYPDGGGSSNRASANRPATPGTGPGRRTPPEIVNSMSAAEFFARFSKLLAQNPAHASDAKMMDSWSKMRENISGEAFEEGVKSARAMLAVVEQLRTTIAGASGWTPFNANIGRYGVNYVARAVVARVGLGANPPEDAVYLSCYKDPVGRPLEGAFQMHFQKKDLPPVEAFWSITVYNDEGYFVANPLGRHALGDRDALRFNPDGSLDLYLQSEPPVEADRKENWLPTPATGRFNLTFRLYWPKEAILKGDWVPPPLLRPPGAAAAAPARAAEPAKKN